MRAFLREGGVYAIGGSVVSFEGETVFTANEAFSYGGEPCTEHPSTRYAAMRFIVILEEIARSVPPFSWVIYRVAILVWRSKHRVLVPGSISIPQDSLGR